MARYPLAPPLLLPWEADGTHELVLHSYLLSFSLGLQCSRVLIARAEQARTHRDVKRNVQTYSFHMYSSMFSSSGPSKCEPGNPHSRKKSPVVRHKVTLTSLPA